MWVPSTKFVSTYDFMLRICNILFGICMFVLPWILVSAVNPPGKGRYIAVLTAMLAGTLLAIINTWNPRHFSSTIDNKLSNKHKKIKSFSKIELKHPKLISLIGCIVFNAAIFIGFFAFVPPVIKDAGWVFNQPLQPKWVFGKVIETENPLLDRML